MKILRRVYNMNATEALIDKIQTLLDTYKVAIYDNNTEMMKCSAKLDDTLDSWVEDECYISELRSKTCTLNNVIIAMENILDEADESIIMERLKK
jgi:hypothetical protein